jgi:Mce-associated membrane protein
MPPTPPTPSTSSTPARSQRRRSTGIRRPRVAGRVPAGSHGGTGEAPVGREPVDSEATEGTSAEGADERPDAGPAVAVLDTPAAVEEAPGEEETAAQRPTGKRLSALRRPALRRRPRPGPTRTRRRVPTVALAVALAVLTCAAVFFAVANATLRGTPAARNTALVDIGATAQVSQQIDDALRTVYSFDFARLDQNEAAARAVITPAFAAQFEQLFGQIRQLAPQQQAVVTATVASSAVREIDGDRAVLVVFLDQQATRAQSGDQPQQLAAAGRLTVTAERVDGAWKIADVQAQ